MIYFANPCAPAVIEAMTAGLLGLIDTPTQRNTTAAATIHAAGGIWCADNGAFSDRWDVTRWWSWLTAQSTHAGSCAFAVAPDVVADAAATYERSMPWIEPIRALGYPAAYVAQNGLTVDTCPWDSVDYLFLGGDTAWKLGPEARELTAAAVHRGTPVHCGRVNSERRYEYARAIGCSSADGTFLTYGPDKNLPQLLAWGRNVHQGQLF